MTKFILLSCLFLAFSCAHTERDPAAVKQDQESSHEKFQGYFDKPTY